MKSILVLISCAVLLQSASSASLNSTLQVMPISLTDTDAVTEDEGPIESSNGNTGAVPDSDLLSTLDSTRNVIMEYVRKGLAVAYDEQREARKYVGEELDRLLKVQAELLRQNEMRLNQTRKYLKSHNIPLLPSIF